MELECRVLNSDNAVFGQPEGDSTLVLINPNSSSGHSVSTYSKKTISSTTEAPVDGDRRLRREIANSNERRRMQSINSGFQSLKALLPKTGDKISKAGILVQTSDYIFQLEQEKTKLLHQNNVLRKLINKDKLKEPTSTDITEILNQRNKPTLEDLQREMIELRCQLDRERKLRMLVEESSRNLEAQLQPDRFREANDKFHQKRITELEKTVKILETTLESVTVDNKHLITENLNYQNQIQQVLARLAALEQHHAICTATASQMLAVSSSENEIKEECTETNSPQQSSDSRRSLQIIVEAIKHLEGNCSDDESSRARRRRLSGARLLLTEGDVVNENTIPSDSQ